MPTCIKCQKNLNEKQFYTTKTGAPMRMCKNCLAMHIKYFEPDTFLWILEDLDVPYIEEEWNVLRDRQYAKDPNKLDGYPATLGKYISKMKLKQWKQYGWADSQMLKEKAELQKSEAEKAMQTMREEVKAQFEAGEISEAEYKTLTSTPDQKKDNPNPQSPPKKDELGEDNPYKTENFLSESDLPDPAADMSKEEMLEMAQKWGRLYKPSEWLLLERDYRDMMKSFDIQDADSISTLILLCKTNLKANQAIDLGDIEGYQRLARVAADLRKTAKFTAAQNKDDKVRDFDCVGNIVAYCEKKGGKIPRYKIEYDMDKVDGAITDIKKYTKTLIYNDTNLAQQIEAYLKQLQANEQNKRDKEEAKKQGLDYVPLSDNDLQEYNNYISAAASADDLERGKRVQVVPVDDAAMITPEVIEKEVKKIRIPRMELDHD